jgi:hypothetical protein
MGTDRAFKPGSYESSNLWLVISFILGAIAAVVGGVFCRLIAQSMTAVWVLAGIVLVLGFVMAIPVLRADPADQPARTADVGNMEAMQNARTPKAASIMNPLIGAVGVMIGGLVVDRRRPVGPSQGV